MGFNCFKATEAMRRESLLCTSKSPGVTGTHLIYLRRIKGQYILSYFYKPFSALSFFRNFAQFSLIAVYVTMVSKNFEIYGIKITRKCIFDSKNLK